MYAILIKRLFLNLNFCKTSKNATLFLLSLYQKISNLQKYIYGIRKRKRGPIQHKTPQMHRAPLQIPHLYRQTTQKVYDIKFIMQADR